MTYDLVAIASVFGRLDPEAGALDLTWPAAAAWLDDPDSRSQPHSAMRAAIVRWVRQSAVTTGRPSIAVRYQGQTLVTVTATFTHGRAA